MNIQITLEDDTHIYNFTTGKIYIKWKKGIKETGLSKNFHGYYIIRIDSKTKKVHRLLYAKYHNIIIPDNMVIDHINRIKTDNRIENLRLVSQKQNRQNTFKQLNNTSGHKNISWFKRDKKWRVRFHVNGKCIYYGCFENIEDAIQKRDSVIIELNLQGNIFST